MGTALTGLSPIPGQARAASPCILSVQRPALPDATASPTWGSDPSQGNGREPGWPVLGRSEVASVNRCAPPRPRSFGGASLSRSSWRQAHRDCSLGTGGPPHYVWAHGSVRECPTREAACCREAQTPAAGIVKGTNSRARKPVSLERRGREH